MIFYKTHFTKLQFLRSQLTCHELRLPARNPKFVQFLTVSRRWGDKVESPPSVRFKVKQTFLLFASVRVLVPVWKNFMELASARRVCLVSSSGADYKAWSGAGQNCNVFVQLAARQRLTSHKPAASQPRIGGQLIKFWLKNHFNSTFIDID